MTDGEKIYLRELAKKQQEIAFSDKNSNLKENWYKHNDFKKSHPVVVIEETSFYHEIKPKQKCEDTLARIIEESLQRNLIVTELIGDDRVVDDYFVLELNVQVNEYQLEKTETACFDRDGKKLGFHADIVIKDIEKDLEKLKPSTFSCDIEKTKEIASKINDVIGDVLPVRIRNGSLLWSAMPTKKIVDLMGMENYFISMYDNPDELHQLMQFLVDDFFRLLRWEEQQGLLTPNWINDHAGACSYGFTNMLPQQKYNNIDLLNGATDIQFSNCWLNINSQETVGISKDMYKEFVLPYYRQIINSAGRVYYGCCEPVHDLYENCLDEFDNISKFSVSPWCDEQAFAEKINGKNIIYSRKPSPNFIGIEKDFNEKEYERHIEKTFKSIKNNKLEIIHRDIYALNGNIDKLKKAVEIIHSFC